MSLATLPLRSRQPRRQALLVTGSDGAFVALEALSDQDPSEQMRTRAKRLFRGQRVQLVAITVLEEAQ